MRWYLHVCWVSCLCAIFIGGALWISVVNFLALDNPFVYNTRGFLQSTDQCIVAGSAAAGNWLEGTLSVEFYGLGSEDNYTLIQQTIFPLAVCLDFDNPCCEHWIDELLYFQVAINATGGYVVTDMADTTVQNYAQVFSGAMVCVLAAVAMLAGWAIVMVRCVLPDRQGYGQVN